MNEKSILIVDDDKILTQMILDNLDFDEELTFLQANTVEETLEILSKNWPSLLIMDYSLKEYTTDEYVKIIKEKFNKIPSFIVMTGVGDEKIAVNMMKIGALDYIIKDRDFLDKLPEIIKRSLVHAETIELLHKANSMIEENELKYRSIFNNSQVGIVRAKLPDLRIIDANQEVARIFSCENKDEMIDKNFDDLIDNSNELREKLMLDFIIIEIPQFEFKLKNKDSNEVYVIISGSVNVNSNYADIIIVDITEQKQVEFELKKAKDFAEMADQSKTKFIANISHEIRTPLSTVIGFSELIYSKIEDEKLKKYVEAIHSAGKNLILLINDLLDMSKLEAGMLKLNFSQVDILYLIEGIENIFKYTLEQKDVKFIVEIQEKFPPKIDMDEVRLRQLLFNLIGNAAKFTEKGYVKLVLNFQIVDKQSNRMELTMKVEDSGKGIGNEDLELIFKPFVQARNLSGVEGGTGLGLSICHKIVDLFGGKIMVYSKINEGSTFTIIIYDVRYYDDVDAIHKIP